MPKPPNALFASSGSLQLHFWSSSLTNNSPCSTTQPRHGGTPRSPQIITYYRKPLRARCAHSGPARPDPADDFSWPHSHSATSIPTPYEIFKLHPSAPYSKRRFYELVKLYHPDSTTQPSASSSNPTANSRADTYSLPPSLRLHRYRLVIQAHSILSDPAKRAAYDRYGAGWAGASDIEGIRRENSERGWRSYAEQQHSPANCATWEDWEGWHEWRRQREWSDSFDNGGGSKGWFHRQRPVYVSNGGFVVLIVFFTIAGAVHEIGRAGRMSHSFIKQLEQKHDETSKALNKRRVESRGFDDNDQRVQRFLKDRRADPALGGAIVEKEGAALPEPEICKSGKVHGKGIQGPS